MFSFGAKGKKEVPLDKDSKQLLDQIDQATQFRRELIRVNDLYFETLDKNARLKSEVSSLRQRLAQVLKEGGRMDEARQVIDPRVPVRTAENEMRVALQQVQQVFGRRRRASQRAGAHGSGRTTPQVSVMEVL